MRVGWEAPRTHVGPYQRPDDAKVLMGGMPGSDAARRRFEAARTPEETEAVSSELLPQEGAHLGDPLDYGMYLVGQLTGRWSPDGAGGRSYAANDAARPLPDFNLDSDRGYAHQCWDYRRLPPSEPPAPAPAPSLDADWPDQWQCVPQMIGILSLIGGRSEAQIRIDLRTLYGYPEPCTVPQRYDPADNPHHRSVYDPLKRLSVAYLPRDGSELPLATWDEDHQVSEAEMRAVGISPTGRRIVP
jgi:hypothetical protein